MKKRRKRRYIKTDAQKTREYIQFCNAFKKGFSPRNKLIFSIGTLAYVLGNKDLGKTIQAFGLGLEVGGI